MASGGGLGFPASVVGVPYDVRIEEAAPRALAAIRAVTSQELYGDWDADPAKGRTDVYALPQSPG